MKLAATSGKRTSNCSLSLKSLRSVWGFERGRLRRSCFGIDRQTGSDFDRQLGYEFYRLRERAFGKFRPDGLLAIAKPKPTGGNRIICVPTIADRLLQFALLAELRPSLERRGLLNDVSYGLIRSSNRGVRDARDRAVELRSRYPWVYKADIQKFFDNVPRGAVKEIACRVIQQRSLHGVVLGFVDAEISDGFEQDWEHVVAQAGIKKGRGVRQGMPLSPYLVGMVLREFDQEMAKRGIPAIRYIDDIIGFFSSEDECWAFHRLVVELLGRLELVVGDIGASGSKTDIYRPEAAADFLGMEIIPDGRGSYCLRIAAACIDKIATKFAEAGSIDGLMRKRVTLTKMGTYLEAMERGYIQAYQGARNHDELVLAVRNMKDLAVGAVLEELFGEQVTKLTPRERRFIGLDEPSR